MQPLPPLLALPIELKLQIFDHLSNHEYGHLWLAILRRIHPLLRYLIPRQTMPSVMSRSYFSVATYRALTRRMDIRIKLLRLTESDHPYLFPPGFHPCFDCGEVVDSSRLHTNWYTVGPNAVSWHRLRYEGQRCYENPYFWCVTPSRYRVPD